MLVAAEVAVAAIQVRIYGHPLADPEVGHILAHLHDHPAEFMAGDDGEVRHVLVAVDVQIGAADARGAHLHDYLVRLARGIGDPLDEWQFPAQ